MKRLWLTIALLLAAGPASAQFNTKGTESYRNALTPNNEFGAPRFATTLLPACAANNLGGMAWDTTSSSFKVCNASTWAAVGGGLAAGDDTDWTGTNTWLDNKWSLKDGAAVTATMAFLLDDITAGQQSVITVPDADFTLPIISQTLTFSGPSAARTITLPDASFTVARVELSNLASVALNTALLPDAAAADDFGSAILPFKDLWIAGSSGTPATNNFQITGASTSGTRVITFPDATGTLLLGSAANVFTAANTFGSAAGAANSFVTAANGFVFEGATANDFETTLTVADPTTPDKVITFPDTTGTVILESGGLFTGNLNARFLGFSAASVNYGAWFSDLANTDSMLQKSTAMTPDGLYIGVGTTAFSASLIETTDRTYDFNNGPCGTSACSNPTFIVHSANQATTQWAGLTHDATNAHLSTGTGGFLGLAYAVEANTGAKTPALGGESDENGELYTNTGDGDGSSVTLPNDPTVGAVFRLAVTVAQTLTLTPGSGETLYYEGDQCAVSLSSATIGTIVEVVAATGGAGAIWIADGGGWTCNDA